MCLLRLLWEDLVLVFWLGLPFYEPFGFAFTGMPGLVEALPHLFLARCARLRARLFAAALAQLGFFISWQRRIQAFVLGLAVARAGALSRSYVQAHTRRVSCGRACVRGHAAGQERVGTLM